jgi:hypothetical protein
MFKYSTMKKITLFLGLCIFCTTFYAGAQTVSSKPAAPAAEPSKVPPVQAAKMEELKPPVVSSASTPAVSVIVTLPAPGSAKKLLPSEQPVQQQPPAKTLPKIVDKPRPSTYKAPVDPPKPVLVPVVKTDGSIKQQ